ncbi:hypothetical protein ABZZ80_41005, partial [Streptomyces sp. NPDC006356]
VRGAPRHAPHDRHRPIGSTPSDSGRVGSGAYNTARTLTDLAMFHIVAGEPRIALPLIDEAIGLLGDENADFHVERLRAMREGCVTPD